MNKIEEKSTQQPSCDDAETIQRMIIAQIKTGGPIARAMEEAYGLRRVAAQ